MQVRADTSGALHTTHVGGTARAEDAVDEQGSLGAELPVISSEWP